MYGIVSDGNICIDSTGGKGTCSVWILFQITKLQKKTIILETVLQGDSGGPLIYNGVQVGLTSFGAAIGCEAGENISN